MLAGYFKAGMSRLLQSKEDNAEIKCGTILCLDPKLQQTHTCSTPAADEVPRFSSDTVRSFGLESDCVVLYLTQIQYK